MLWLGVPTRARRWVRRDDDLAREVCGAISVACVDRFHEPIVVLDRRSLCAAAHDLDGVFSHEGTVERAPGELQREVIGGRDELTPKLRAVVNEDVGL